MELISFLSYYLFYYPATDITDGRGLPLPKSLSIPHNDTRAALTLRVTRMDKLPTTQLLKVEATSKQTCFENGTDIQIVLFGKLIFNAL